MEINSSLPGAHGPEPQPHKKPQRARANSDFQNAQGAEPAATPSSELRELAAKGESREGRKRTLFRSRKRDSQASQSTSGSPSAPQGKEIVRAVEGAVLDNTQPNPVEALNLSLQEVNDAVGFLRRALPPALAEKFDVGKFDTVEQFIAGNDKLLQAFRESGLLEALMAPEKMDLDKPAADTPESEHHTLIRRLAASPHFQSIALAVLATVIKTTAWYGQTAVSDNATLKFIGAAALDNRAGRAVLATAVKIVGSWLIALAEYVPFTAATTIADKNGIKLAKFRGILQPIDLITFLAFVRFVDNQQLLPQQLGGLGVVVAGSALANMPEKDMLALERLRHDMEKKNTKMSKALGSLRAHTPILKNKDPRDSHIELKVRATEARALAKHLSDDVAPQLRSLQAELQTAIGQVQPALADGVEAEPTEQEAVLAKQSRRIGKMLEAIPKMVKELESLAGDAGEHSEQKSNRLKKLFNRGWWIAEGAVAVSSSIFLLKHDPMAAALTLSAGATGVKTLAWFKHTTKTDEELLPDMLTPKSPKLLGLAQKAARIGYSWGWAFFEYVQLTIANRVADVVPVRGAIEVMDLVWMATFMYMVKGDKLKWQQAAGLAAAAAGVGIANL
jgi:uncharacterized protein (DUF486 family)